ncbi:glycerol-3-phosphate dehydrogenase [Variovorax sp. Root473]|uniref:glycerol-3-phosphate dehydrogenase n=1 Tax=Variovorax sp. Root473 TaxID=1736541 RepID=UPI0006F7BBFC|nr:glycerol-3-phosphate dehydrogenase [Variovorax sp. Root473]KQX85081.1 glycerol-3-phosphate dehydrogenase [Variovorax sp. Root473]
MKKRENTISAFADKSHEPTDLQPVTDFSSPAAAPATDCDVLIVGGGINGCGIARDLAGRGWRVVLCEKDDLASHTSSSSTKLIHGGLRYLEYYEFSLVRKALQEREVLLKSAPHIMWPLRFVMPHDPSMRPAWMIRIGLFMYDHLAKREVLPPSRGIDLRQHPAGAPLKAQYKRGFVYSDGWVDDARLVVLNAIDARSKGAEVLTRTRCIHAQRGDDGWVATLEGPDGAHRTVRARAVVNAAGPWAESFLRGVAQSARGEALATKSLRLVKGSHIIVPRLFDHDHAYIFQNPDKRIIFAIPYQGAFTLIGTTDIEISGDDPGGARIAQEEIDYLCTQASRYFDKAIVPADVVWTYSGVRPLLDDASGDPSAVTRDYLLESNTTAAPLLSVWGGKITTFRKLAEDAADEVGKMLGQSNAQRPAWTDGAFLAGGDLSAWIGAPKRPDDDFARFVAAVQAKYPWLDAQVALRLARGYGARVAELVGEAQSLADMGAEVAPGLYERELRFLQAREWAVSSDDVLWRRTKLGLHYTPAEREQVAIWLQAHATNNNDTVEVEVS